MTIVKLNKKMYISKMQGRGIHGRYSKVLRKHGYGIGSILGKEASKYVLGGLGKSSGAYAGKQLGKLIQEKTGSELLGKIAKSGLSSLGGLAGQQVGKQASKLLSSTVFSDDEKDKKKKKKKEEESAPRSSLSELLEQARNKVTSSLQQGSGINYVY